MSKVQEFQYTEITAQDVPFALGILGGEETSEGGPDIGTRAVKAGFQVLLTEDLGETLATDIRHHPNVTVVDPDTPDKGSRDQLISAAKERDLEGIVFWNGGSTLDFDVAKRVLKISGPFAISTDSLASPSSSGRLIGIPAYNESVGIGSVILRAQQYAEEVVIIDDGSSDDTVAIAKQTGATVIEHGTNQGKGRALQTFFAYARETEHDSFVVLDGDGQHLPEDIPAVIEPVENGKSDLVVGSRYLEDGTGEETPFHRRVGQQVLDYLTFGSSGTKLTDTQSGFRAFSPDAVDKLSIRTDGMGVESEMISTAQDADLEMEEVPIDVRYEGIDGQTLNPLHHGLGVATFLLKLIRDRHPLMFFGLPGVLIAGVGIVLGIDAVLLFNSQGTFAPGQTMVSLLLTVIGSLGVFCGLVLNRMSNMIRELKKETV
ncbi:glycosyltransferase family 2 protein [Natronosalvus amylolyticus]|uniref:glycosyltransferase family 2 protein n=1 Tax=Natronosalvus amylolyticus TaxID=2961994 RepID=UPI0020C98A1C|nr:glycosyltransferase family 2 protein [Natronosalvus amylolyticus]